MGGFLPIISICTKPLKGLKGEQIPLSARIVTLPDVYDALTSKIIYKEAFSHQEAKDMITLEKNRSFDADVVESFLKHESDFKNSLKKYQ